MQIAGAALSVDFAWLIGAGFAPLVALWLSSSVRLGYVSLYCFQAQRNARRAVDNRKLVEND